MAMPITAPAGRDPGRHHHIPELQSVRGLAALLVVLHHCSFAFIGPGRFNLIAQAVLNAHAAVVLFFVLSGYVLTRSMLGHDLTLRSVGRFYVTRAFRIYPALWAVLVLVTAYYATGLNHRHPIGISDWFQRIADQSQSKSLLIKAALGIDPTLLNSLWSITVELQGSLLLPLLVLVVRRGVIAWLVLLAWLIAFAWSDWPTVYTRYLDGFAFGAGLCLLAPYARHLSMTGARIAAAAGFCLMMFFRLLSPNWRFLVNYSAVLPGIVEAIGAAILLGVIAGQPGVLPALRGRLVSRLGDISYSLYLVHLIILIGLTKAMLAAAPALAVSYPVIATGLLMLGVVAVSLPAATFLYVKVELPGIRLGRATLARFSGPDNPAARR
jgi:peptidoglycan/LPS O-acetylase OafA/YrhL